MEWASRAKHVIFSIQMSPFYPHLDAVNYQTDLQPFHVCWTNLNWRLMRGLRHIPFFVFFDQSKDSNFEPAFSISLTNTKRDIVIVLQKFGISLTRPLIPIFWLEVSKKMKLLKLGLCGNWGFWVYIVWIYNSHMFCYEIPSIYCLFRW
jgi:hypothetical protein